MFLYRILCAVLLAWAVNWALARPEAAALLLAVPRMALLGPVAGAFVGFFSLSLRQGWGFVVAFANGVWAGVLSVALSGALYMIIRITQAFRQGLIDSFDRFMVIFGDAVEPLVGQLANLPLLIVTLGAAAIVGVVTEFLHWLLVKFRRRRQRTNSA